LFELAEIVIIFTNIHQRPGRQTTFFGAAAFPAMYMGVFHE
jgi:hypothetical protein